METILRKAEDFWAHRPWGKSPLGQGSRQNNREIQGKAQGTENSLCKTQNLELLIFPYPHSYRLTSHLKRADLKHQGTISLGIKLLQRGISLE